MSNETEVFELATGYSVIDVRGGEFDLALFVGGQPIALNWSDCEGSVAQYLARAGWTDCENELQTIRHTLEGHWLPNVPISSQLYPFLELFVPGRYQLRYIESPDRFDYIEFNSSWNFATQSEHYYPFGNVLVLTQSTDSLNPDRVAHYLDRIRDGERPIALTATAEYGWCEFVLDGHHKLKAYRTVGIKPRFVSVCRLDAPRLTTETFDTHFGAKHPMARHYRKVKIQYDLEPGAATS